MPVTQNARTSSPFFTYSVVPEVVWGAKCCMRCHERMPKGDHALFCPDCLRRVRSAFGAP